MNQHLDAIDAQIAAKHLLTHPFYLAWTRGQLTVAALADYARQYYHHVAAFPTYLSAIHAHCDDQPTRRQLLDNLIDEEGGSPNHPELWLQFANGVGVAKEDDRNAEIVTSAVDSVLDALWEMLSGVCRRNPVAC